MSLDYASKRVMNILKPKLINVDGRQYRHLTQVNLSNTETNIEKEAGIAPYIEEGGEQKQMIENQTKTVLKLPKKGQDGDIEISGNNQSGILTAQSKIMSIIDLNRRDQPSTHFLAINLVSDDLKESFNLFKNKVIQLNVRYFLSFWL
nr:activating signal cointegrator 1 complex subunit 1-like [Hydra vulgaris]